jgi:hypothetical protein
MSESLILFQAKTYLMLDFAAPGFEYFPLIFNMIISEAIPEEFTVLLD